MHYLVFFIDWKSLHIFRYIRHFFLLCVTCANIICEEKNGIEGVGKNSRVFDGVVQKKEDT